MEEETQHKSNKNTQQLTSSFLHSLRGAARDLRINNPIFSLSVTDIQPAAIAKILKLETESGATTLLSGDPNLFKVSQFLTDLKTLHRDLEKSGGYSLRSILRRRIAAYRIYQLAIKIEAEIRVYFDRELIQKLVKTLQLREGEKEEDEKIRVLEEFEERLSSGFDREFQELVLKAKLFSILESLLCKSDRRPTTRVKEHVARAIVGLVRFNKDVFVGLVLMGSTVPALVSMGTRCSIQVLTELVSLIRTPLIDEMELDGQIPRVVALLGSNSENGDDDRLLPIKTAAFYCVCEIAYHGRKEVIEAMLEQGLIKKLVELQRSRHGDNFVEAEGTGAGDRPFGSCVAKFAVQVEVGEGLSGGERKELKREMVERVRDACVSEAEAASILAEVLWGSTP
ncbi:unnamed protein product [Linum tenue]|uniref:Uncharacterized protein n=1 Tax=Linum tenue TaxID=586396 RepID=A0AAV0K118_9ROSI|nr:unnamed protein product [Linum tenue]